MTYKLLVVDDDDAVLQLLPRILRREGFYVRTAQDVDAAEHLLEGERFDAVLTDIQLPGRSGLELTRMMKEKFPEIKTVLTTAFDQESYRRAARDLDVLGYMSKPISTDELLALLNGALNQE